MDKEGGSMDLQQRNWRKPLAGVVLLLLLLTGAWCVNDTPEPPVVLQKEPERNKAGQGPAEVKGLAEADNSKPLRNPFSLLHETEAEAGRLAAVPEEPALSGGKDTAKAAPAAPPVQAQPVKSKAVDDIVLCGIAEGAGGRLALVRVGGTTAAVAAGETVQGWQITAIGTSSVVACRDGQERNLAITSDREGAGEK